MGACLSTIINACKEIVLSAIPSTQLVPDSEETAMSSTVVPYSGVMPPSDMSSIPSTQPSVLSAIPSMQLVPDSEETNPLAMSSTAVPDFGEMVPLAMSSNPSTQPSVLSAIPSMQLVPASEETDPSAMPSAVVRDSGEMVPSAISSNTSLQPSVLSAIPSMQLVPDSEETALSAMSSTVVPYSGVMPLSAMSFIPSMQPSVLFAIPSTQLVPDSKTDPSSMNSTVVADSGEMAPLAMPSIPSKQPCVLSDIPSMQLVPDSETDPLAMSSTVVPDSREMAPLAMSSNPSTQPSVLSVIPSMQLVPDFEKTDPSAISSTVVPDSGQMAPSAMSSIPSAQQSTTGSVAPTSSSIENACGCGKYEVFINHRGIDTKDSLASTIYHTLDLIGVRAFFDREELETGEVFSHDIEEAIRSAFVHIAIFSANYAESRWCLHELTLMLQTGKKIIPIFYHVETSHVKDILGDYSKAFSIHEEKKRYSPQQLEEWKTALSRASDVKGYEVNERQKDEGFLLKNIVNDILKEKTKNMPLLHVATHPVGLDKAIQEFQNIVDQCAKNRQNIKIVGIVGLGGCGKTTLAKEYFNKKISSYTKSCFLSDVRDAAARNRLHDLQEQLLKDLVRIKKPISNTREGKGALEHHVRSVKALIILDDVNHINQIESLLPLKGNLQPESLVIVTTRDLSVIESSASLSPSVSVSVHRMKGLDQFHAKQLFCWHAFLRESPVNGFEDLVNHFLSACQGLPLSLKVLGAQLFGKSSRGYWESLLHKISKVLPEDVKQILQVSYDALDEEQQQMFLDVACFFIEEPKDMAISIWDGSSSDGFLWSGWHGFQNLENKCLVEVDHENRIRMHDQLRDLGREIAVKETPSRFWSHSQFVNSQRPLEKRLPMRGIIAATGSSNGYCNSHYEPPFEECMQLLMGHSTSWSRRLTPSALGLQLLVVRGNYINEQFKKLTEELVWLRWYDFPHDKLPSWLASGKLRALELYNPKRLAGLWGPNDSPPSQLRELTVKMSESCDLQMIPETIGFLKHLKKIVLSGVSFSSSFKMSSLPEEFCLLESLEHLELQKFRHLSCLPTHFGNLRKLKHLDLWMCQRLTALPVSFNQLTELQYLDLSSCEELQLEIDILENITKLEILRLRSCFKLEQLPTKITRQMNLRELCLSKTGLRELPADIDKLARLEVLKIGGPCLTSLPTALVNLSSLTSFTIDGCLKLIHFRLVGCLTSLDKLALISSGLEYLPGGFGQLVNLQTLTIRWCPIRELPLANPMGSSILLTRLLNLVDSSMFKFPRLKRIFLLGTKVSTISISQDCCPGLEELFVHRNYDLMEIKALPTTLKRVDIFCCTKLKNIMGVAGLAELQDLEISGCPVLDELPSFAALVKLQRLMIWMCRQLHKLPGFGGLVELLHFSIEKCPQLDEVPSFACCTCLQDLKIEVSKRITQIEGLEDLRSLERLKLITYWKVPGIKGLKNLDKLTTLQITAESRSAIETCIPLNIMTRPCRIVIVGRAVEDVESVVGSLSFPNLTVVDKLHPSREYEWEMKAPLWYASRVIVCFVLSYNSDRCSMRYIHCDQGADEWGRIQCYATSEFLEPGVEKHFPLLDKIFIPPLGEKQVYIGVCPKGFYLNEDSMEGGESVFLTIKSFKDIQIEKGIAVIMREGEEEKASEALHKILELLQR